jgi:hypothetical protein
MEADAGKEGGGVNDNDKLARVTLTKERHGASEVLWAQSLGNSRYKLLNNAVGAPFKYGDVVVCAERGPESAVCMEVMETRKAADAGG